MHVCHVINNLEVGGAETMLLKLLGRVRERGIESSVITLIGKGVVGPQIEQLGIRVDSLGMVGGLASATGLFRVAGRIRQLRPDIVCTWMYQADLVGGLASRLVRPRTPVIWNLRTSHDGVSFSRTTRLVRRACASLSHCVPTTVLCNSHAVKEAHARLGYKTGLLHVIPNGFDLDAFRPSAEHRADVRRELGVPSDARLIGMMARCNPDKDHPMFLKAAHQMADRWLDVHFVLAGADVTLENPMFATALRDSPHRSRFHLLERRNDMARVQASLDIGVLASVAREGFPNAVGEAMACGVPCIVTDTGGSPEVVGDCGVVVPAGAADQLAAACSTWLSLRPQELTELGMRARNRVRQEFSLEVVSEQYVKLWRELSGNSDGIDSTSVRRAA